MRRFPEPDPGTPDIRGPWHYLWWLAVNHRRALILGSIFAAAWTVAQGLSPAVVGAAINAGIVARDQTALIWWGVAVLALGVVQALSSLFQDRFSVSAKIGSGYQTLQFVTRHACRLGASLSRRVSTGDMVTVGVSDIDQIGRAMEIATRGFGAAVAIVVIAVLMLAASWQIGLLVLIGVPVMLLVTTRLVRPIHRRQDDLRTQQHLLTDQAVDIVQGLRILRGIGGEEMFASRYQDRSQAVRVAAVRLAHVDSYLDAIKSLLPGLLVVLVVAVSANRVLAGQLSPGELVAFYGYSAFLAVPLRRLTQAVGQTIKAQVAAEHITRLLRLETDLETGPADASSPPPFGALTDPVSGLTAQPRRFTVAVCSTPADAAALADRLGRYAVSDATYHGQPLAAMPLPAVRDRILVGAGDARLFAGPLRRELDPADRLNHSDAALWKALDAASAGDIVHALPDGLDTVIATAGREFSGGQRQRLRLVRALMDDPEVLILIDPTSAVDALTEARIAAGLRQLRADRTTLVFSTSMMLLDQADHVVLVIDGRAVAEGTHEALMVDERYRSLVARGMAAP